MKVHARKHEDGEVGSVSRVGIPLEELDALLKGVQTSLKENSETSSAYATVEISNGSLVIRVVYNPS